MQSTSRYGLAATLLAALTIATLTAACGSGATPQAGPPPPPTIGMLPTRVTTPVPEPAPTRQTRVAAPTHSTVGTAPITPTTVQRPIVTSSFTIGNTLGRGMALRAAPRAVEIGKTWPDGTKMDGLGAEQDAAGWTWSWVRDPDGNAGWVPTNYLVLNEDGEHPAAVPPGLRAPSVPPTPIIVPTLAPTPNPNAVQIGVDNANFLTPSVSEVDPNAR